MFIGDFGKQLLRSQYSPTFNAPKVIADTAEIPASAMTIASFPYLVPSDTDGLAIFCDVCGNHTIIHDGPYSTQIVFPEQKQTLPDGWMRIDDIHLCPECAAIFDEIAVDPAYEESLPCGYSNDEATTLSEHEAVKLLPDESGTVVIPEGYTAVGSRAFMYREDIRHVIFPTTMAVLCDYAFSCSGLEEATMPDHLAAIGDKAFYRCADLTTIALNEGLIEIGDEVFANSALATLALPSSLQRYGRDVVRATSLSHVENASAFAVDPGNRTFMTDGSGALYLHGANGLLLREIVTTDAPYFSIAEGTAEILPYSFEGCSQLASVDIPEGVSVIRQSAFLNCTALKHVTLPQSLQALETDVFAHTLIPRINIPSRLTFIGPRALDIERFHTGHATILRHVDVDEGNPVFYLNGETLYARRSDGTSTLVRCFEVGPIVTIPASTTNIAPQAFMDSPGINEFHFEGRPTSIHPYAFPAACIKTFRFKLDEPVCESPYAFIRTLTRQMLTLATLKGPLDVSMLYDLRDHASSGSTDLEYVIHRLAYPQYLSNEMRQTFERVLSNGTEGKLILLAKRGSTEAISRMADLGYVTAANIEPIIEEASRLDNVALVAFLLDLKQKRFGMKRVDFSL